MKILLTGANGFIGSVLLHQLLAKNHIVKAPIRKPLTIDYWKKLEPYLFAKASSQQFSRYFQPWQITSLEELLKDPSYMKHIDVVIHTAAHVHQMTNPEKDQQLYESINHDFTKVLAIQAEKHGVKQFIFLSSIKVNGESNTQAFTEVNYAQPHDTYALTKLHAELTLKNISENGAMSITIIRTPLVYGPGVKANFTKLLAFQQKVIPFPVIKPDNQRSLCYVENLAAFMVHCLLNKSAFNQIFLIADQEKALSTRELNQYLSYFSQKYWSTLKVPKLLISFLAKLLKKTAMMQRLYASLIVDCSRANKDLKWQQPVAQLAGLYNTARWYQQVQKESGVDIKFCS